MLAEIGAYITGNPQVNWGAGQLYLADTHTKYWLPQPSWFSKAGHSCCRHYGISLTDTSAINAGVS